MKILLGTDHAGYELKNKIFAWLKGEGFDVEDMGAHVFDKDDDYPKILVPVAMRLVAASDETIAVVFGKSGQGEAMIMNRFPGVRAAVYHGKNLEIVKLAREHNNANVLSLAAAFVEEEEAIEAVRTFIGTQFSRDARHVRRIEMLDNIE
jgi:ribose 5-phosphate isomerase B